mmetsp:Transcript_25373/g.71048  ORF Transcript_25373/g.71048 Transcript_25373/m.71048 type:complete len:306 (+) Transcript_25373:381-1298(+)
MLDVLIPDFDRPGGARLALSFRLDVDELMPDLDRSGALRSTDMPDFDRPGALRSTDIPDFDRPGGLRSTEREDAERPRLEALLFFGRGSLDRPRLVVSRLWLRPFLLLTLLLPLCRVLDVERPRGGRDVDRDRLSTETLLERCDSGLLLLFLFPSFLNSLDLPASLDDDLPLSPPPCSMSLDLFFCFDLPRRFRTLCLMRRLSFFIRDHIAPAFLRCFGWFSGSLLLPFRSHMASGGAPEFAFGIVQNKMSAAMYITQANAASMTPLSWVHSVLPSLTHKSDIKPNTPPWSPQHMIKHSDVMKAP